ncbi:MAG: cytochrome c oxidase subunit 3 [Anaerolineales bacterium]|nr:cytochrome c oxidase subunit 3 [Anaerolineales bacterium]
MAHTASEHAHDEIHLPAPTFWPLVLGVGFFGIVAGLLLWMVRSTRANAGYSAEVAWGVLGLGSLVLAVGVGGWVISGIQERRKSHAVPEGGVELAKFSMWCFLGTETVIFGGLIANAILQWILARQDGHTANELLHHFQSLMIVSGNTFILLASSLFVVLALAAIQRGDRTKMALWLTAVAVAGAVFIGIQAFEYNGLFAEGFTLDATPFSQGFFFLTGFHGLHVAAGVLWAGILAIYAFGFKGFSKSEYMGVEVFGLYWHFVDVVWIFIFTLVYLI